MTLREVQDMKLIHGSKHIRILYINNKMISFPTDYEYSAWFHHLKLKELVEKYPAVLDMQFKKLVKSSFKLYLSTDDNFTLPEGWEVIE